ncbi:MAG TPA: peptidase C45, partial [Planctomycetaceae bacterium]|nr:peptidase C45 [Planctomycetaceae bacterium]
MPEFARYREIEVAGLPFEMGRQIGEAAREEIAAFCELALDRLREMLDVSSQQARAHAG